MQLIHLKQVTASLAAHTFHPGMAANRARQAQAYIHFCDNCNHSSSILNLHNMF